jgi:hypothetical protein
MQKFLSRLVCSRPIFNQLHYWNLQSKIVQSGFLNLHISVDRLLSVIACCLFPAFVMLSSCDSEEEAPDQELPIVSITSPSESLYVKGTITISGTASDNNQLKSVTIFIDNLEIKNITPEGAAHDINETLDTKSMEDGIHHIKIVAIDLKGNRQSATAEINVLNYFFKFTIPPDAFSTTASWFYVTKPDGTIVAAAEVTHANEAVKLETPDGFDLSEKFIVNHYTHNVNENVVDDKISTYVDFSAGSYTLRPPGVRNVAGPGQFIIHNTTFSPGIRYTGIVDLYDVQVKGDSTTGIFRIENNPSDILFSISNSNRTPRFQKFDDVAVNSVLELDYNTMTPFDSVVSNIPGPASFSYTNTAVAVNGKYSDYSSIASMSYYDPQPTTNPVFYVPGNEYSQYMFFEMHRIYNVSSNIDNVAYNYFIRAAAPPAEVKILEVALDEFTLNNDVLMVRSSGNHDYKEVMGIHYESGLVSHSSEWFVYFPGEAENSIKLVFPPEVIEACDPLMPDQHQFDKVTFTEGLDYDEFAMLPFNLQQRFFDIVTEYKSKTFTMTSSGGRKAGDKSNVTPDWPILVDPVR